MGWAVCQRDLHTMEGCQPPHPGYFGFVVKLKGGETLRPPLHTVIDGDACLPPESEMTESMLISWLLFIAQRRIRDVARPSWHNHRGIKGKTAGQLCAQPPKFCHSAQSFYIFLFRSNESKQIDCSHCLGEKYDKSLQIFYSFTKLGRCGYV